MRKRKSFSEQSSGSAKKKSILQRFPGISTIEYAFLIIIVVAAFLGMAIYFKRAISGRWRQAVDDAFGKGRQYDPYATEETEF